MEQIIIDKVGWYLLSVSKQQETQGFNAISLVKTYIQPKDYGYFELLPVVFYRDKVFVEKSSFKNNQQILNKPNVIAVFNKDDGSQSLRYLDEENKIPEPPCNFSNDDWSSQSIYTPLRCKYAYWIYVNVINNNPPCPCPEPSPS